MVVLRYLIVLALACAGTVAPSLGVESDGFVYQVDSPDAPPPRFRSIDPGLPAGLSREKLLAVVDPDGQSDWRLGWFTYGEGNSRSIGVGLRGKAEPALYVDVDRNQQFSESERAERESATDRWTLSVGAEFITALNGFMEVERAIWIRRSKHTDFLDVATRGVMTGTVTVDGKPMAAMRIDRNSNGRWFDSDDRILLDSNGDGVVDPIGGRISCDSICRIAGKRYVIQSDSIGEQLALAELTGTGVLTPRFALVPDDASFREVVGAIVSRSGVRVPIRGADQPVECPVGEYRIESLTFEVSHSDRSYWFRFSPLEVADHPIIVTADQTTEFDLLGEVTLSHQQASVDGASGTRLIITPLLKTASGLYLSGGKTGQTRPNLENRLLTQSVFENTVVENNSTGFS